MEFLIAWVLTFTAASLFTAALTYLYVRCVNKRSPKKYMFLAIDIAFVVVLLLLYAVLMLFANYKAS